jgi:hypothetical protein
MNQFFLALILKAIPMNGGTKAIIDIRRTNDGSLTLLTKDHTPIQIKAAKVYIFKAKMNFLFISSFCIIQTSFNVSIYIIQ